jgi:hypothetical protein
VVKPVVKAMVVVPSPSPPGGGTIAFTPSPGGGRTLVGTVCVLYGGGTERDDKGTTTGLPRP